MHKILIWVQSKQLQNGDVMGWTVSPQNSYVILYYTRDLLQVAHDVTVSGDRAFKEVTQLEWGYEAGP